MSGESAPRPNEGTIRETIARADALRERKRFVEAVELLSEALRAGGDPAEIQYRLGNVYVDEGRLDAAEGCYKKALSVRPDYVNAMHNLAIVYKRQGRVGLFVRTYKRSRRIDHRPSYSSGEEKGGKRRTWLAGRGAMLLVGAVVVFVLVWSFTR